MFNGFAIPREEGLLEKILEEERTKLNELEREHTVVTMWETYIPQ
jgi:hypothetical protein